MGGRLAKTRTGRYWTWHEKFMVEERVVAPSVQRQLYIISAVLIVVGLAAFLVVLNDVLNQGPISGIDKPVQQWMSAGRSDLTTGAMIALSVFFGPVVFPWFALVVTVGWIILARHVWRPLLLAIGTAVGVVGVRLIAETVGRERPPVADQLFEPDTSESFPSGHVVGASLFILLIAYLVFSRREARRRAVLSFIIAGVAIVVTAASRLYLGYHWTTDAIGSVCLALVILGAVIAVDTYRTVRVKPET